MLKNEIRKEMKDKRIAISEGDHKRMTKAIFEHFINSDDYKKANVIFAYIDANNEVGTRAIIKKAFSDHKQVAVPKITDGNMDFYVITSFDDLEPGYFNIPEPKNKVIPNTPDIILVPGVAFSYRLERLGYGKGFYDRYLTENVLKIGLAFEFQTLDTLPVEEHDIKMDKIITEKQIIH